ncbi:MAG: hypothetical protein AAFR47_12740 [Pseudomonadota bacterium]
MAPRGWHILRDGAAVTVSRAPVVQWDVAAETTLPAEGHLPEAGRLLVASQVRQDLWRALRRQRGFSPAVRVAPEGADLAVRAGGRIDAVFDRSRLEVRIAGVLSDSADRARWIRNARRAKTLISEYDREGAR